MKSDPRDPHRTLAAHVLLCPQVKQLRLEREREKAMREQELELLQREKEAEHFKTWEEQEDHFHLQQAKLRCARRPPPAPRRPPPAPRVQGARLGAPPPALPLGPRLSTTSSSSGSLPTLFRALLSVASFIAPVSPGAGCQGVPRMCC